MKPYNLYKNISLCLTAAATLFALENATAADIATDSPMSDSAASGQQTGKQKRVSPRSVARASMALPAPNYLTTIPLTITAGAIKILPMQGKVRRVALGSGSVLSTTTVDSNLLIIAEQVGITTLLVWTDKVVHSYRVQVVPQDLTDVRTKVDALINGVPGITVQQVGADLVLNGFAHHDALVQIAKALKDTPGIIFNVKEDQGSPYTRSVLFRLHFVEVKRSLLEKIGIDWAKDTNGPVFGAMGVAKNTGVYSGIGQVANGVNLLDPIPAFVARGASTGGIFLGLATTITSRINLGIADGDARVLASPELTAKSGGKARLQVGGEVPIPLAGAFGATTVEFKPYGIIFSIEPQIDGNDVITAKVSTELSQIDPSVSVGGIPGFITRNTTTEVSLKQGEVVALSGLVNSEMSTAVDRVPGLSRVPILGSLFQSEDFRNRKTELIVLLEPQIIQAGDGLAAQLRDRGLANKREFENKVLDMEKKSKPAIRPAPDTSYRD